MNFKTLYWFLKREGVLEVYKHFFLTYGNAAAASHDLSIVLISLRPQAISEFFSWRFPSKTYQFWKELDKKYQEFIKRISWEELYTYAGNNVIRLNSSYNKPNSKHQISKLLHSDIVLTNLGDIHELRHKNG